MKKTIIGFASFIILVTACNKNQSNLSSSGSTIVGKWNIDNVTTYFYDSSGLLKNGVNTYPGENKYYFQFNSDNSWEEFFTTDPSSASGISGGTYSITSDSTFTLLNPQAIVVSMPCKIISLTNNLFVFSKQQSTSFNGNDPGYIKYVFKLVR